MFVVLMVAIVFVEQGAAPHPGAVRQARRSAARCTAARAPTSRSRSTSAGVISIIFASSVLYLPVILLADPPGRRCHRRGPELGCDVQQFVDQHLTKLDLAGLPDRLRPADHRLRLLLHGDHVRPATSRPTRSASRAASSPASGPAPRPSATWPRSSPGSPCPAPCSSPPSPSSRRFVLGKVLGDTAGGQRLGFFGISILIAVGVALETMKQIDSQLMMRNYEGFLNTKTKSKSRRSSAMTDGVRLVMLGRQGAGKGTQCVRLSQHYVVPHISTGDMLRAAVTAGTEFGLQGQVRHGRRRPRPRRHHDRRRRRAAQRERHAPSAATSSTASPARCRQAEALERSPRTARSTWSSTSRCPEDVVLERSPRAGSATTCGHIYSVDAPPKNGWICDVCGGEVVQRADDTEEAVRKRLDLYARRDQAARRRSTPTATCWSRSTASARPTR